MLAPTALNSLTTAPNVSAAQVLDQHGRVFDAPTGEDDGWQVSVSAGQVFGLQGYTNTLSVR